LGRYAPQFLDLFKLRATPAARDTVNQMAAAEDLPGAIITESDLKLSRNRKKAFEKQARTDGAFL